MRLVRSFAAVTAMIAMSASTAESQRLAVRLPSTVISWGYNGFSNMQSEMTSAFGGAANVETFTDISSLASLASSTALYLDLGTSDNQLTVAEQTTLAAYIGSGRRVFFLGENSGWTNWNNSFLSVVGGTLGLNTAGTFTTIVNNELTAGVTSVRTTASGTASGGTQLLSADVMQLRGAQQNVFSAFDYNAFTDAEWSAASNARFGQNVSTWLAGSSTTVPEPGTLALLAVGLALLIAVHRRRRA